MCVVIYFSYDITGLFHELEFYLYCTKTQHIKSVLVSAAAGNKSATRPPLPPPACGGEWKERGRSRWVGIRAV